MKIINRIFLLIPILLITCNDNSHEKFNEKLIQNIFEEGLYNPSSYYGLKFYCKCDEKTIVSLDVYELREIYLTSYKNLNYHDFLTEIINQKLYISNIKSDKKFSLNESVKNIYTSSKKFSDFLEFYCTKKRKNMYRLKNNIPEDQKNTILYFLFLNNYITNFDDYSGSFVITKME